MSLARPSHQPPTADGDRSGRVGIFDSGVGGLTVLRALRTRLPAESFLYLGDTARLPYGTKSAATVQRYALNAAAHLVEHGIKLLVVACNTATSFALQEVADASPVPVLGVVEPGVHVALDTEARRIGVIGTEGTIRSGAYQSALERLGTGVEVRGTACPLLVPLAEEGWGDHPVTDQVASHYLQPLLDWGVQTIILGCTHYPMLCPSLQRVVGPEVRLVDSASAVTEAVVRRHSDLVAEEGRPGAIELHLTDASDSFLRVARAILGEDTPRPEVVTLGR
jgi:glutamate racemase